VRNKTMTHRLLSHVPASAFGWRDHSFNWLEISTRAAFWVVESSCKTCHKVRTM
jgi:hypothetical protein